ncbi:DoxX family protein [Candidatus Jorgensenbacteria bacterium]|nr:DoxX family protein [Candidatus Jorgensenbacteria bacterium]
MFPVVLVYSDWGLLILRVVLGVIMVVHGWPKLKDLKGTSKWFDSVGFKPGVFWATLVGIVEFVGGLALIEGTFTQIAAFLLFIQFLVILFKVKRGQKLVGGYELDLLIAAVALALLTTGGGPNLFEFYNFYVTPGVL